MTTEQIIAEIDKKREQLRKEEMHIDSLEWNDETKNLLKFNQKQQAELREARRLLVQNPVEIPVESGML